MLVEPGWRIRFDLMSQLREGDSGFVKDEPESDAAHEDDQPFETACESKLRHTINFYRTYYFGDGEDYLYKASYDKPVMLDASREKPRKLPVLEDIRQVIFSAHRDIPQEKDRDRIPLLKDNNLIGSTVLQIHSPFLLNALRSVVQYSSEAPSGDKDNVRDGRFDYPYKDL